MENTDNSSSLEKTDIKIRTEEFIEKHKDKIDPVKLKKLKKIKELIIQLENINETLEKTKNNFIASSYK